MSAPVPNEKFLQKLQSSELWGKSTRQDNKYVTGIICPECGKPEAYLYVGRPQKLYCNRRNHCGRVMELSQYIQGLEIDFDRDCAPTAEDPRRPATAYLESRGLKKCLEGLNYRYESNPRNLGCGSVMFAIQAPSGETVQNGRIFCPPEGEGKTHNIGSTAGCVWRHPGLTYDPGKETFVTEGIINALSLIEAGHQAVAVLSSGQDPAKVDLSWLGKIVLAFDNDHAGHKALRRFMGALGKGNEQAAVKAVLPIGGDWNDLLLAGQLETGQFKASFQQYQTEARLACAASPNAYAKIWNTYCRRSGLFEFHGRYYFSTLKDSLKLKEVVCHRMSDFTVKVRHFELENTNPAQPVYRFQLHIQPKSGPPRTCTVTAQDLASPQGLRTMFLERGRVSWTGDKKASDALVELILKSSAPIVRQVDRTGYDLPTGCYIFQKHMIDRNGQLVLPDKNGFFKVGLQEFISPPRNNTLLPDQKIEFGQLVELLTGAWGDKAMVSLAWTAASWFVNQIKAEIGFFPFLSLYGDSQTGKSNLTRTLNTFQCLDVEGIPMRKTNTAKGEIRKMGQFSGVFIALLEWPHDGSAVRFDLETILTLFNVNPLQVRALKTNDLRTHETQFLASLMFVQNREPFVSKPQRERVVSLEFKEEELNDATRQAFNALDRVPASQKASVYPQIMQHRPFFEQNWYSFYQTAKTDLERLGLSSRILETHGLILGFHRMLGQVMRIDHDLLPYMREIASKKQRLCLDRDLTIADEFFEIVLNLSASDQSRFSLLADGRMLIQKPEAERIIKELGYQVNWRPKELGTSLKAHPAYEFSNRSQRLNGASIKVWGFDAAKLVADEVT